MARTKMTEEEKLEKKRREEEEVSEFKENAWNSINNSQLIKLKKKFDEIGIEYDNGVNLLVDKFIKGDFEFSEKRTFY